ncbi:hypothetical protein HYQ44_014695 [Verticillium longisporum]|nr:hypothetical protein HYQ44_014695 [Verticillium longisporum]
MAPLVFQAISLLNGPTHTQTPKLGSDQAAQRKLQNRGKLTAGRSKGCTSLQGFRNPLALHNSRAQVLRRLGLQVHPDEAGFEVGFVHPITHVLSANIMAVRQDTIAITLMAVTLAIRSANHAAFAVPSLRKPYEPLASMKSKWFNIRIFAIEMLHLVASVVLFLLNIDKPVVLLLGTGWNFAGERLLWHRLVNSESWLWCLAFISPVYSGLVVTTGVHVRPHQAAQYSTLALLTLAATSAVLCAFDSFLDSLKSDQLGQGTGAELFHRWYIFRQVVTLNWKPRQMRRQTVLLACYMVLMLLFSCSIWLALLVPNEDFHLVGIYSSWFLGHAFADIAGRVLGVYRHLQCIAVARSGTKTLQHFWKGFWADGKDLWMVFKAGE